MKTQKSNFALVKEIEARRPQKLTKEYCEEYLNAIHDLLSGGNDITKEEAEEYFITLNKFDEEYTRIYWKVLNYLENHF